MEHIAEEKGADLGCVEDPIPVNLRPGRFPGVESGGSPAYGANPDISGEEGVEGAQQLIVLEAKFGPEAGHLSLGMDAGVGPACSHSGNPFSGQFGQGCLELALNRPTPGLSLPAAEIRAVVADGQPDYAHSFKAIRTASSGVLALMTPLTSQVSRPITFFP